MRLPEEYLSQMKTLLGESFESYTDCLSLPAYKSLRVNTLKITPTELTALSALQTCELKPVPFSDISFYYTGSLGAHPYHRAGLFYLQEPSASLAVLAAAPYLRGRVLDLCAAPGGKSTQAAAVMQNRGLLLCNETEFKRCRALMSNLERMGITNAAVTSARPDALSETLSGCFDAVLADAPCSGEGMLRKSVEAAAHWSVANSKTCAVRQLKILECAADCLRPGGVLIYSTCTFNPDENEKVIERLLNKRELSPLEIDGGLRAKLSPSPLGSCAVRAYPHLSGGEGHFVCLLKKNGDEPARALRGGFAPFAAVKKKRELERMYSVFTAKPLPKNLGTVNGSIYALPDELPYFPLIHAGLKIAEEKPGRLEPCHALAMSLKRCETVSQSTIDFAYDSPELDLYLKGGESDYTGPDGYKLITAGGFPLGLAKASGGKLKNKYPKGLRLSCQKQSQK